MNDFKEWLSDNLRYFIVGAVVILIIGGSIVGLRIYSTAVNPKKNNDVIVETDPKTTEASKDAETGKDSEKSTDEKEKSSDQQKETNFVVKNPQETEDPETEPQETEAPQTETEAPETEAPETEPPQTEPVETEPPKPVYLTINSACYMRSYPDYGDNIIGEYSAGTTVQFLEDVGGWYKVSINGAVGYMGARFFN